MNLSAHPEPAEEVDLGRLTGEASSEELDEELDIFVVAEDVGRLLMRPPGT